MVSVTGKIENHGMCAAPEGAMGAPPTPPTPPSEPKAPVPKKEEGEGVKKRKGALRGLRVSLMPVDESEGKPDLKKRALVLLLVLVVETFIIGGVYFFLTSKNEALRVEKDQLQVVMRDLSSAIAEQEETSAELTAFNKQISAIEEKLDEHVYWTGLFNFLEKSTKSTVFYESFSGSSLTGTITMNARTSTFREMSEQILAYRVNPLIDEVRASSGVASIDEAGSIKGVNWLMTLVVNEEVWSSPVAGGVYEAPSDSGVREEEEESVADSEDELSDDVLRL